MGAVLYTNYRGHSIEVLAAGEPGWLTRGTIQAAFYYPFVTLGVWNVLTMINRSNAPSRELNRRLGFVELCVIETGGHRGEDIILYSMTREKCLWVTDDRPGDERMVA
jgi:L-amino acid N-acyltransferase YncA